MKLEHRRIYANPYDFRFYLSSSNVDVSSNCPYPIYIFMLKCRWLMLSFPVLHPVAISLSYMSCTSLWPLTALRFFFVAYAAQRQMWNEKLLCGSCTMEQPKAAKREMKMARKMNNEISFGFSFKCERSECNVFFLVKETEQMKKKQRAENILEWMGTYENNRIEYVHTILHFLWKAREKKTDIVFCTAFVCLCVQYLFFLSLLTLSFPCSMCQLKQVTWWLGRQITNGIHKERAEENAELTMNIKAAENLLAHQSLIKLHYMQHSSIFQTPTKVKKKTCWIVLKNSISKRIEFPVLILLLAFFLAFLQACALHGFNIVFLYFQMTSLYSVKQFWHFQDCRDQIELLMR